MDMNQSDRTFGATKTFRNQVTVDLGGAPFPGKQGHDPTAQCYLLNVAD